MCFSGLCLIIKYSRFNPLKLQFLLITGHYCHSDAVLRFLTDVAMHVIGGSCQISNITSFDKSRILQQYISKKTSIFIFFNRKSGFTVPLKWWVYSFQWICGNIFFHDDRRLSKQTCCVVKIQPLMPRKPKHPNPKLFSCSTILTLLYKLFYQRI